MIDLPPDTDAEFKDESTHRTPRWVKVFGISVLVLVLLFIILQVISRGRHGPGRHSPPSGVTEHGVQKL